MEMVLVITPSFKKSKDEKLHLYHAKEISMTVEVSGTYILQVRRLTKLLRAMVHPCSGY